MDWTPTEEGLSQLLQLIKESVSPNNEVHSMIQQFMSFFFTGCSGGGSSNTTTNTNQFSTISRKSQPEQHIR
ncbi:10574_t:CDS:2 [Entrophospora sp. SA101]|nr:10574_t:CDS:2 [Entrophospora sp. SA101]